ncbi:MAG: hypothetical protein JWR07_157 [Nevskia sp.]|nr:hypothetical protein [Nevskia sp.]
MGGLACVPHGRLTWHAGQVTVTDDEFTGVFHDELQKANYPVVGNQDNLFPDPSESSAELMVGGRIDKLNANICSNVSGMKGGAFIHVDWEIYDVIARKVVYKTATEGSYKTEKNSQSGGVPEFMTNAFDIAVQNLLADEGFHALVTRKEGAGSATAVQAVLPIIEMRAPPAISSMGDARAASVTVLTGTGHGSGFIISPDGYVITNQHVVQEARAVKVRLATQREVVGEVVRTDAARDVALIKLAESNLPAVSIRSADAPEVGDEVFAIGAPLLDKLDVTVTRGIVSAYRDTRGFKFIQSDVSVHPGSSGGPLVDKSGLVVGVCDWGMQTGGVNESLNFFIPIADAVTRLQIHLGNTKPTVLSTR